jgi:biotin synthase
VPINLLNPRPGTKFGDRELIDPWEAVKWIAIFRLILPAALFRLCGGRVENLGELQPLAVRAGLNGVMMGNFLTTLGAEPHEDREMFERHGLNVARQEDNAANPRPDNRSGWLTGETPDVIAGALASPAREAPDVQTPDVQTPDVQAPDVQTPDVQTPGVQTPGERAAPGEQDGALEIRLWNPATQLRYRAKRNVPPRPDGAPNRVPVG